MIIKYLRTIIGLEFQVRYYVMERSDHEQRHQKN